MLVLTRHKDGSIVINGNIEITILDVRNNRVRIGIAAPPEVAIHRKEIQLQIEKEKTHATEPNLPNSSH